MADCLAAGGPKRGACGAARNASSAFWDPVDGKDVLELGCGAGRWSASLAQRGARVVGLDISMSQLQHADPADRVNLVLADARSPAVRR